MAPALQNPAPATLIHLRSVDPIKIAEFDATAQIAVTASRMEDQVSNRKGAFKSR
jgi:hypothetical protein